MFVYIYVITIAVVFAACCELRAAALGTHFGGEWPVDPHALGGLLPLLEPCRFSI